MAGSVVCWVVQPLSSWCPGTSGGAVPPSPAVKAAAPLLASLPLPLGPQGCRHRHSPPAPGTPVHLSFPSLLPRNSKGPGKGALRRHPCVRCSSTRSPVQLPPAVVPTADACILAVVGTGAISPLQEEPWEAVMAHMAQRLLWTNPSYVMNVVRESELDSQSALPPSIVVVVGVHDPTMGQRIVQRMGGVPTLVALDCGPAVEGAVRLGGSSQPPESPLASVVARLPWGKESAARQLAGTIDVAWGRNRADDVLFGLLLLIDAFVAPVPQLAGLRAQDLATLQKMVTRCGPQIWGCLTDSSCKEALDCLNACPPNDQVCSYRCIVTYESPLLEAFSLCVLQKHNCLGLSAEPPSLPAVQPMATFRGQPLTHETAEDVFVGWLRDPVRAQAGRLPWSWRVVAGVNAAYDSFPCQYQLFYRGKARNTLWYDPVFKVQKLDSGEVVWRRRHYRVRRADKPGTFYLSVLDNGVTSNEYWRIVDCAEDLSWALFYYAGAAAAAGQAYSGAVLVTPDGNWPAKDQEEQLCAALDAAGIKLWELYRVDNRSCEGAPLEISSKELSPNGVESSLFNV